MLAFHTEERRDALLSYVIDLYADDLDSFPNAVSLERAHLDRSGYYALARPDPANNNYPKERQLDFFGGLRWRVEEHVPAPQDRPHRAVPHQAGADPAPRFHPLGRGIQYLCLSVAPQHHHRHRVLPHRQGATVKRRITVRHPHLPLAQLDPVRMAQPAVDGSGPDGTGAVVLAARSGADVACPPAPSSNPVRQT